MKNSSMEQSTRDEIDRLGARSVFILGGPKAISSTVESYFQKQGYGVTRVSGDTRYETAVRIAQMVDAIRGVNTEVFFACASNYPDALGAGAAAAIQGSPILYIAKSGDLGDSTREYLRSRTVKSAVILGGYSAVGAPAEEDIMMAAGVNPVRIAGSDRYDTNLRVNRAYAHLFEGSAVVAATGENYPDALAGGVLAASMKAPMLLVPRKGHITLAQSEYIASRNTGSAYILGGTASVSGSVADSIAAAYGALDY